MLLVSIPDDILGSVLLALGRERFIPEEIHVIPVAVAVLANFLAIAQWELHYLTFH